MPSSFVHDIAVLLQDRNLEIMARHLLNKLIITSCGTNTHCCSLIF